MFWGRSHRREQPVYIIVKEQHGRFDMAMGNGTKTYTDLRAATLDAGRFASKLNDGRYFVFQAVSVSEVLSPSAVTRPLAPVAVAESEMLGKAERVPRHA